MEETNGVCRQESTDSLESNSTQEEYSSDDDKDDEDLSVDDFQLMKTIGKFIFIILLLRNPYHLLIVYYSENLKF